MKSKMKKCILPGAFIMVFLIVIIDAAKYVPIKYNYDLVIVNTSRRCVTINNVSQEVDPFGGGNETFNEIYLNWIKNQINVMNKYRKWHNSPPVKLNLEMCRNTQYTTDYLVRHKMGGHSSSFRIGGKHKLNCGENGFGGLRLMPKGDTPTGVWYDEIRNYNFINRGSQDYGETGHFMAMISKSVAEACITSSEKGDSHVAYGQYYREGKFEENIGPLLPAYRRRPKADIDLMPDIPNIGKKQQILLFDLIKTHILAFQIIYILY